MKNVLQALTGVIVYVDDILVAGSTKEEHVKRLEEDFAELQKAGFCMCLEQQLPI